MKINITVTEKELHDFYKYGEMLRQEPCKTCPDLVGGGCCGCPKQSTWAKSIRSMAISRDDWTKYSEIREYTEALLDLNETEHKLTSLLYLQAKQSERVKELLGKFQVVD